MKEAVRTTINYFALNWLAYVYGLLNTLVTGLASSALLWVTMLVGEGTSLDTSIPDPTTISWEAWGYFALVGGVIRALWYLKNVPWPKFDLPKTITPILLAIALIIHLIFIVSCATHGATKAKSIDITTSKGGRIQGTDIELGQDFQLTKDADGTIHVGLKTTAYHVQLDAQEKAALIEGGKIVSSMGTKALAAWLTSGASEVMPFVSALVKAAPQLESQSNPE